MSLDAWLTIGILILTFSALLATKLPPATVFLGALTLSVTFGLAPLDRSLATVFANLRSSSPYLAELAPGGQDPEQEVLADTGRPMVLYELTAPTKVLRLTKTINQTIELTWR
jgi:hypothetical protein